MAGTVTARLEVWAGKGGGHRREQAAPREPKGLSWVRILYGATSGGRPHERGHSLPARPPSRAAVARKGEGSCGGTGRPEGKAADGEGTCSAVGLNAVL